MIWTNYCLGVWLYFYIFYVSNYLFPKPNKKWLLILGAILLFALGYTINTVYVSPLVSFIFYILLTVGFIFCEFHESYYILFRLTFSLYLIRFGFEILLGSVLFVLHIPAPSNAVLTLFTSILSLIFIVTFDEAIRENITNPKFPRKEKKFEQFLRNNLGLLLIVFIRIPHYRIHLERHSIINLLLFFIGCNLLFLLFQEKEKNNALNKNYNKIVEYSTILL